MKTSVQVLSEIEVKIEVEVPVEKVDKELDRQLGEFGKRARLKGFRPGKAPKDMVRKSFGADIATEATKRLINETFGPAIQEAGTDRAVGEPQIEPGLARQGEPLKYAIRVQVKPKVEVHSWKDIEVSIAPPNVTAEQVNAKIAELQKKEVERVPVEDRGADTGDILVLDFEGYLEGKRDTRLDGRGMELQLGQGRMIPGFEDGLMGAKVGESRRVEATFPSEYGAADLQDKKAHFEVTVTEHLAEELPELDDGFASDLGFDDFEALRADTHAKLQKEADEAREQEIERKILAVVFERNPFPLPPAMVEAWLGDRARNMVSMLKAQGFPENQAWGFVEKNLEGLKASSAYQIRRHLTLEALGRQEKIEVDDETLSQEIVARIQKHGEQAGKLYERADARSSLMEEMVEKRALEAIIASAHVVSAAS